MHLGGAAQQVVLDECVGEGPVGWGAVDRLVLVGERHLRGRGRVAVPVPAGHQRLVHARELLGAVVQGPGPHPPVPQVDRPAVEPGGARRVGAARAVAGDEERRVEVRHVDDDVRPLLVRVERVRVVDRVDLEPAGRAALAGQHADPRRMPVVPDVRHEVAALGARRVEGDRHVEDHHVVLGEREVVDHRRVRDWDPRGPHHLARRADDQVPDAVPGRVVGDRVQLVGPDVELGVRGERALERAPEVVRADGVQLVVEFVRQWPALLEREDPPPVGDHMGVAREVVRRHGTGVGLAELLRHLRGAHPAVAVPLGPALTQPHPVHHAVAEHPVVGAWVLQAQDVGAVAQVAAVQLTRDAAGDRQVEGRQLLGDRLERTLQEGEAARRRGRRQGRSGSGAGADECAGRRDRGRAAQHAPPCGIRHLSCS